MRWRRYAPVLPRRCCADRQHLLPDAWCFSAAFLFPPLHFFSFFIFLQPPLSFRSRHRFCSRCLCCLLPGSYYAAMRDMPCPACWRDASRRQSFHFRRPLPLPMPAADVFFARHHAAAACFTRQMLLFFRHAHRSRFFADALTRFHFAMRYFIARRRDANVCPLCLCRFCCRRYLRLPRHHACSFAADFRCRAFFTVCDERADCATPIFVSLRYAERAQARRADFPRRAFAGLDAISPPEGRDAQVRAQRHQPPAGSPPILHCFPDAATLRRSERPLDAPASAMLIRAAAMCQSVHARRCKEMQRRKLNTSCSLRAITRC